MKKITILSIVAIQLLLVTQALADFVRNSEESQHTSRELNKGSENIFMETMTGHIVTVQTDFEGGACAQYIVYGKNGSKLSGKISAAETTSVTLFDSSRREAYITFQCKNGKVTVKW